jgi:hypothetical protein
MTNAAREDEVFRSQLEELAQRRGGIYARALEDLESREPRKCAAPVSA